MWMPVKNGARLIFNLPSDSTVEKAKIGLTLAHNPEGGEISASVNGKSVKFDGNETVNTYEPFQTKLVNHFSREVFLKKGDNEITIQSVSGQGKKIGIDFIWVKEF